MKSAQQESEISNSNRNQQEISQNRRLSDVDSDVDVSDFRCDICGRTFKSQKSLEMHRLRVHKIKPSFLKKTKGRGSPPAIENELLHSENRYALEFKELASETANLDPFEKLYVSLRRHGLSQQNSLSVINFVEGYDLTNVSEFVSGLNRALNLVGMPQGKKILFLESYCRNQGINPLILTSLGIKRVSDNLDYNSDYPTRSYYYEKQKTEPAQDVLTTELVRSNAKVTEAMLNRVLNAKNDGSSNQMVQMLLEQNRAMRDEVRVLREQMQKQENENLRSEIKRLSDKIESNQNSLNAYSITLKKLDIVDKRLADILNFAKSLAVPQEPPKRQESKESSKHEEEDLDLPRELIIESEESD